MAARGSVGRGVRRRAVAWCVGCCFRAIGIVADLLGEEEEGGVEGQQEEGDGKHY